MKRKSTFVLADTFDEAIARIATITVRPKKSSVDPKSETIIMTHGHKTADVYVLLHGFTNSPHQFRELGHRLYAAGHNVLIPRMPHHGLSDRLNKDLQKLTASTLADYANNVAAVAAGLGEQVHLIGLSTGGVLAAYIAHQTDIESVILIAPSFGLKMVPAALTNTITKLLRYLPNRNIWWGEKGDMGSRMLHAYPRWSTKALGGILQVGRETRKLAKKVRPKIDRAILILNENDMAINKSVAEKVGDLWEKQGVPLTKFTFPSSDQLDHDLIDPEHPMQNIDYVYSKIMALIELSKPLHKA